MRCLIGRNLRSLDAIDIQCSIVQRLHFFQFLHPFSSSVASSLESTSIITNKSSFTISYLVDKCGFPHDRALAASKYISFESSKKPDSVLTFFKNHSFTPSQISHLIRRYPPVLQYNAQKTLLPKLEFFQSKGFSNLDIAKLLCISPGVLGRSLENQIIPIFTFFRNFLNSDEDVVFAINSFPRVLLCNVQAFAAPNAAILKKVGVPDSNIAILLKRKPRIIRIPKVRFEAVVEGVKKIGFNPSEKNFVLAICIMRAMSSLTWERKMEAYKKWGLSEDQVITAFRKHPWFMMASEEKISAVISFFVNKTGWEPSFVAQHPVVLSLSLKKRIIPRCSLYKILVSKESSKFNLALTSFLKAPEKQFVKLIKKFCKDEASELLKTYQEKLQDVPN